MRLSALGGLGILPAALLFAVLDFPDWAETPTSFVLIFAFALPLGLVFRVLLHGLHWYVHRPVDPSRHSPREDLIGYSTPVIAVGAACVGAYAMLAVASRLTTGDWSP